MAFEIHIKPPLGSPKLATPNWINVMQESVSPFDAISGAEARVLIEELLTWKNNGEPVVLDQDSVDDMVDLRQILDDIDLLPVSAEEKLSRKMFTIHAIYRILTLYAQNTDLTGYTTQAEIVLKIRNIVPTWR